MVLMPSTTPTNAAAIDPGLVLKITPPKLRKSVVVRERLRDLRAHGEDVAVFLVEAPAGFGKTSLLAQWRLDGLQAGVCAAWLSLDGADTPVSVISGVVHGLRRGNGKPSFCHDALEAIRRGAGTEAAVTSLLAEISETAQPVVLTFDNCERVHDTAVLEMFDYLLHNLPPNLQLAFGSRPSVPIRLGDLLSQGNLQRVTADDLRFDLAETIRLLSARLPGKVDADAAARLHEITEGWPLGLQLAAVALEKATDIAQAIRTFSASGDDATRELFDRMIETLPSPLLALATHGSLLDALHPSLCEAVMADEDAPLALQQLLAGTPLLTAAEDGEWLRLHPLAREYLRKRAESSLSEDEHREIHVRAWRWYASHALPEPAARHALAAGRQSEALELVASSLEEQFEVGNPGLVAGWLARIPPEEVQAKIELRLLDLWIMVLLGQPAEAVPAVNALTSNAEEPWVRADAMIMLQVILGYRDEIDQIWELVERCRRLPMKERAARANVTTEAALNLLDGQPEVVRQILARRHDDGRVLTVRVWGDMFLAESFLWEGRPILAEQAARIQHAQWEARAGRRGQWTCLLGAVLAAACWQRDMRDEAQALLANRLDVIEQSAMPILMVSVYCTLARIAAAGGDEVRALGYLEALTTMGASRGLPRLVVASLAERVRLHAAGGRPEQAESLADELVDTLERSNVCRSVRTTCELDSALSLAYAALAADDNAAMTEAVDSGLELARKIHRGYESVQLLALRALLTERAGGTPGLTLTEALSRAEAGGLVRVFADSHPAVIDMIRRFATRGVHGPVSHAYIDHVLAATKQSPPEAARPASSVGSAILTPKEEQVLKLLAGGLANKRIAAELNLSSETVKWHVKKLFAKLDAGTREHAVGRARMLGLLP